MNPIRLTGIKISGFKNIIGCDLELKEKNILIGPNGAGKSNFLSIFRLIQQMQLGKLQVFVGKKGGADSILHFGRKTTKNISIDVRFTYGSYQFHLQPTEDNRIIIENETVNALTHEVTIDTGHYETGMDSLRHYGIYAFHDFTNENVALMKSWNVFHFHDAGESSLIKQRRQISDNLYFRSDASNLAAFLFLLKHNHRGHYDRIVKTVRLVAPFFEDFLLRPILNRPDQIELEWIEKHDDVPLKAHLLSDGTIRFICLATLLLQPDSIKPKTILIDEPELGLHPYAIDLLGGLWRTASKNHQIIISTQSMDLLNCFTPEDIIVTDRNYGQTHFKRLNKKDLGYWLEDYSLGKLWEKNVLGGTP